ncbi:MAG: 5-dehydro-4-deoxy-D-glucuronate isomerase [Saprospiraceae bacterium]|nr:5-dehydro-4-deoxy-D-glucuronate isomerase [Saprospiraceae bacterium]
MQIRHTNSPLEVATMNTEALRQNFLLESIFEGGRTQLTYSHYDRVIAGGAMPLDRPLSLPEVPELRAAYFLERRELGIINLGGPGQVSTGADTFPLYKLDCLYLGKGIEQVAFSSADAGNPARFFLLSAPAHREYPTRLMTAADAAPAKLGAQDTANARTIYKYIHPDGIASCQLVMGLTVLESGSVWNTMPPHTHDRRMEVYCYFDIPEGQRVLHLMGQPDQTRHLWMSNHQAVISPPWSIHAGCGTMAYSFIWGMAGENQSFADMDFVTPDALA